MLIIINFGENINFQFAALNECITDGLKILYEQCHIKYAISQLY